MLIQENRDHEHRSGDEKHARNGGNRRVDVLNDVVDLALEVARGNAERDGEGERRKGGERADHDRRPHALQGFIEHVVADGIRPEDVPIGPEEQEPRE